MSRISIAAPHLSLDEVKQKIRTASSFWHRQKWSVVYNALVDPRPASEIAQHTGVSLGTVHRVISKYNLKGTIALETPGKGGRRNCYLTFEEEKEFLATFFQKAAKGKIPTVKEIKLAFEKRIGQSVNKTTIYRLLDRHQWRKIVPRPCHPKGYPSEREAFKKTLNRK